MTNINILKLVHSILLFGKLGLACEDEILNTTATSLNDDEMKCEKK